MSQTVKCHNDKQDLIPAVVHADKTSRIQTLTKEANPLFYDLISKFYQLSKIPMVLNTSFNIKGEPMTESPRDALQAFLNSELDALALENLWITKKEFPKNQNFDSIFPHHVDAVTSEIVANANGDPTAVHLMAYAKNFDSNPLELGLLEACDGNTSLANLQEEFASEWEIPKEETLKRIKQLWKLCLVHFG